MKGMVNTPMITPALRCILALTLLFFASIGAQATQDLPFKIEAVTAFDEPWAMVFLPDGQMLVTEKKGQLLMVDKRWQQACGEWIARRGLWRTGRDG